MWIERKMKEMIGKYGKIPSVFSPYNLIDLESSNFELPNESGTTSKDPNWYKAYGNIAVDLSKQGFNVFISCHPAVRKYIGEEIKYKKFVLIYPDISLKNEWIKKLSQRYAIDQSEKNLRAYERARDHFVEDFMGIQNESKLYAGIVYIKDMNYNLGDIIKGFIKN